MAEQLSQRNIGSLLFDLLDEEESKQRERVFDIPLLAQRLSKVSDWIEKTTHLPQAFFGGSTGAGT